MPAWTRLVTAAAVFGLGVLVTACSSARRSAPILGRVAVQDPALAPGRQAFDQYCHACHPGGGAGLGPALNSKPLPGALIAFQVRHGLGPCRRSTRST